MKCLCCGKPIKDDASEEEKKQCWHKRCIEKFFGLPHFPEIDLSADRIGKLYLDNIANRITVTGVQKKLSLHIEPNGKTRLTLMNYPSGFILKPQVEQYPFLPEYEYLAMSMAKAFRIKTVPFALVKIGGEFAYITKRIDRQKGEKLAMEDFCQLDNRLTEDKYKGSYERCSKIIRKYSSRINFDLSELFMRVVFSFLIGNSDMHLKNFSLIEEEAGQGDYALSPAYDLLPTNLVLPGDVEEFALTMNGKKTHLRKKDFLVFGESIGLNRETAIKIMEDLIGLQPEYVSLIEERFLTKEEKEKFIGFLNKRISLIKS